MRRHYEPLTSEQWAALTARSLQELEDAELEPGFASTGAAVFGWRDRRKVDASGARFSLRKRFAHLDARGFRDETWAKLQLERSHRQLFPAAVAIRAQVVQRAGDERAVFHRVMFNPATGGVVHALEASVRLRHRGRFLLLQRSIERNAAIAQAPAAHAWMRLVTSLVYAPASGGRGCDFQYAGCLRDLRPADARFWLAEMLWVILRFERVMVAPLFRLEAPPATCEQENYL